MWKLWVMLGADEMRNMLKAVVWLYLIAKVRYTTVKQFCTGYEWLQCDTGGRNAFKLTPCLGGHNFHWSQVSSIMWGPRAFLQKIEHYYINKKSLSLIAIPSESDRELVWHLHFAGCRQGQRSLLNSCLQEWMLEVPKVEFSQSLRLPECSGDFLLVVGLRFLQLVEEKHWRIPVQHISSQSGAQLWMQGIIYLEVLSFFPVAIRDFDMCECDESHPRHALMSLSNSYFL